MYRGNMATTKKQAVKKAAPKKAVRKAVTWPRDAATNIAQRLGQVEAECIRLNKELLLSNQTSSLLLSAFVGIKGLTEDQVRRISPDQYRVLRELEQARYRLVRKEQEP